MQPKPGSRALGIAASDGPDRSQLGGAVVRADRVIDDLVFSQCTTGGSDATAGCCRLWDRLARADVQWLMLAGIAPAWFNIIDLPALADYTDRPAIAVSFEQSRGLAKPLEDHFEGEPLEARLEIYRRLPDRQPVELEGQTVYVRAVGISKGEAAGLLEAFTPEGHRRPEPLRVARCAARAGRQQYLEAETNEN